jgi:hypothetical protein
MQYILILITMAIGILSLIGKEWKTMKQNIINTLIIILAVTSGVISGFLLKEKQDNFLNEKIKCEKALSRACNEIYLTVADYNKNKENNDKDAKKNAIVLFQSNGRQLETVRSDYKEHLDSIRIEAIDDAVKTLLYMPEQIIQSRNRCDFLYNDIWKIDSTFKKKISLCDLIVK